MKTDRRTRDIPLKQRTDLVERKEDIAAAFTRHAQREANHIEIDVEGGVTTLTGEVDSLAEHDAAIGTAYAAKGVTRVIDRLHIGA